MKYPEKQFSVLTEVLKQISVYIDLKIVNIHSLHFVVYQQLTKEGQNHNKLFCVPGIGLKRFGNMTEEEKQTSEQLIKIDFDFDLYPTGCNDNHIETAMKQVLKNIGIN